MKLVRFGPRARKNRDIWTRNGRVARLCPGMCRISRATVSCTALAALAAQDLSDAPPVEVWCAGRALGPWVPNFYCIGLNYAAHAAETGRGQTGRTAGVFQGGVVARRAGG